MFSVLQNLYGSLWWTSNKLHPLIQSKLYCQSQECNQNIPQHCDTYHALALQVNDMLFNVSLVITLTDEVAFFIVCLFVWLVGWLVDWF